MSRQEEILERMRTIDPVPQPELIHESDLADLDARVAARRRAMRDVRQTPMREEQYRGIPPQRGIRPAWVFALALAVVIVAVGVVALFLTGGEEGGEVVATTAPATIAPTPAPTEPAPATSAVEPTVPPTTAMEPPSTTAPTPPATTAPTPPATTAAAPLSLSRVGIVYDVTFDSAGTPWVVAGSTLLRYDGGSWQEVALPSGFRLLDDDGVAAGALAASPDGSMWVTGMGGLAHYADGAWTVYTPTDGDCGPAVAVNTAGEVWAICPDTLVTVAGGEAVSVEALGRGWGGWTVVAGADGSMHMSTPYEILSYDGSDFSLMDCPEVGPSGGGCWRVLGVEPDGHLWASYGFTGLDGVMRIDPATGDYETFVDEANGAIEIAVDGDGTVWFAVGRYEPAFIDRGQSIPPGGVVRYDGAGWRLYSTEDGLSSDAANRVEIAPDGTLWVGTDLGIDVYDAASDRFVPFEG